MSSSPAPSGAAPAASAPPPPAHPPPPPPHTAVPPPSTPLVGAVGQEYVAAVLSSTDPRSALREVAAAGGLGDGRRCGPLLGLLDACGVPRAAAHAAVLDAAAARLLARIEAGGARPDVLARLLAASFPYIGLPALRAIPLAVLGRLRPVPPAFLQQLAADRDLFADLPPGVQRQVWELDRGLLAATAAPLVAAYAGETGTLLRALDAGEWVGSGGAGAAGAGGGSAPARPPARPPRAPRRLQRAGSPALKKLVAMVGRSPAVYRGVADLVAARVREAPGLVTAPRTAGAAALRSQLLMALHDAGGGVATDLAASDPVHKLAWTLDACGRDGVLDDRREREVAAWFARFDAPPPPPGAAASGAAAAPPPAAAARGRSKATKRARGDGGDAESAGGGLGGGPRGHGGSGPGARARALCDAALVLRDPSTLRLIAHCALARLEACALEEEVPPGEDGRLAFLTRLLQVGAGVRDRLRDVAAGGKAAAAAAAFPAPDPDLMRTLYPTIAGWMLEGVLGEEEGEGGGGVGGPVTMPPPDPALVSLLARSEVARLVTQAHALARVGAGDGAGAAPALAALADAFAAGSEGSAPEWAPFAAALAKCLAGWAGGGGGVGVGGADAATSQRPGPTPPPPPPGFTPGTPLWSFAVERLLVPAVGAEPQVHEEVLRLVRAAAPVLGAGRVGPLLAATLAASQAARRRAARRRPPATTAARAGAAGGGASSGGTVGAPRPSSGGYSTGGGGGGSASAGGPRGGPAVARSDGVRFLYAELERSVPGLGVEAAPALHAYLNAG